MCRALQSLTLDATGACSHCVCIKVRRGYIEGSIEGSIEGTSRVTTCACSVEGRGCCIEGTSRVRRGQGSANKTWAAVAKLFHPLVAASQLHPVDVAQPEHNQYTLCGHLRTSSAGSHCHCAQRCCAGAAPQQRRRCSSVAPAASPAHKAQLTTALMAQGWCHESVDIATAQGAVQQLRATVPHRSSVAAAAVSPLQRRRCTKRMWVLPATGQRWLPF